MTGGRENLRRLRELGATALRKAKLIYAFSDEDLSADDMVRFAREARRSGRFTCVLPCEGYDVAVCYSAPRRLSLERVAELYSESTVDLDPAEYPAPDLSDKANWQGGRGGAP